MVLQRQQRSAIDILIAFIAVPLLILCALQLEKNMQASWENSTDTRWIVFVLGISMLLVSLLICGYVTHRLGMCMWVGPLEDTNVNNRQGYSHNTVIDVLPPTYDNATKFDILPPTYESVVIQINDLEEKQKMNPVIHI